MQINKKLKIYIILFVLSFLIRIIFYFFYNLPPEFIPDTITYTKSGFDFFEVNPEYGKRFIYDSDIHMPLYSILSYIFNGRENLILFDIFLSSLSSILIYLLTKKISNNNFISLISAILFCFNPFLIFFSITGLTETSYIFLLILFCVLICNKKYIFSFIVLCISIYIRPTIEIFYPIIIFCFLYFFLSLNILTIFRKILLFLIVYVILLTPWWIHNYIKYEHFVRINLAPSYSFYLGNNELSDIKNIKFNRDGKNTSFNLDQFNHIKDPIEKNKQIRKTAISFIINNPNKFVMLCLKRMLHYWQFYPNADEFKDWTYVLISILSFSFLTFFSIVYFLSLNVKKLKKILPFISIIISINLVHILTISSLRYRLPIEPFLIIFASNGILVAIKFFIKDKKIIRLLS